jgi:hypothetical protein
MRSTKPPLTEQPSPGKCSPSIIRGRLLVVYLMAQLHFVFGGVYLTPARRMEGGNGKGDGRQVMKELSLAERHIQESEEHVARIVARIEEFKGLGLTQAANEKRVTLLALRKVLAEDREHLRQVEKK